MNNKILFISNYTEATGWGQAGRDYLLALDASGLNVVSRPLFYGSPKILPNQRIKDLEAKTSQGCDTVIQHCLPHLCRYNGNFAKNICLFVSETSHFRNSVWAERLNTMDEVWVACHQQVEACKESGVKVPVFVWPHACDIERFQQSYPEFELLKPFKDNGSFIFYSIGEINKRKNWEALLKAFYLEFDYDENVELVLKVNKPGHSKEETINAAREITEKVKNGLKLYGGNRLKYKPVPVLADMLTPNQINQIHTTCDCYVTSTYGESWGISTFDAMAFAKTPISTNCGGTPDYLSNDSGWLVDGYPEPVYEYTETFNDMYVGNENWWSVDISKLRKAMRESYENKELKRNKGLKGIERAYDFSYEQVGNLAKTRLQNGPKTFAGT